MNNIIPPQQNAAPRRGRLAFTLIELLVVIAILALLVSLLFPLTGKMLDKARQTQCASNQRQVGAGMMVYAMDHEGLIPISVTQYGGQIHMWPLFLSGSQNKSGNPIYLPSKLYNGNVYLPAGKTYGCPANPTYDYDLTHNKYGYSNYSYAMHASLEVDDHTYGFKVKYPSPSATRPFASFTNTGLVPNAAQTVMGGDSATLRDWGDSGPGRMMSGFHPRQTSHLFWSGFLHLAHNGRANLMFFDGHVQSMTPQQMNKTMSHIRYVLDDELNIIDIEASN
ncbi:prepilin-type N-terminal cleavage/methylation domain-containing protein [Kiritimatiellota bacterium B12222]|nr:prepilin-type N-terminal cleavage/methylation domain-containing protein [Kiritimatiellota bacterium B12222]